MDPHYLLHPSQNQTHAAHKLRLPTAPMLFSKLIQDDGNFADFWHDKDDSHFDDFDQVKDDDHFADFGQTKDNGCLAERMDAGQELNY